MNTNRMNPPRPRRRYRRPDAGRSISSHGTEAGKGRILGAPDARMALLRGIDRMAALVRPTIGPLAGTVVIAGASPRNAPEVLDSAATILRRTIEIEEPFANMGAMLVRQLAHTIKERVGDGSATAVILAHALLHLAAPPLTAGINPHALRRGIERGLVVAQAELRGQARPVASGAGLTRSIAGTVRDPDLADTIGEVVEAVGPDGAVLVEETKGTVTTAEYIDGQRWNAGLLSPYLLGAGETVGRLLEPCILVTDCPLTKAEDFFPVLEACIGAGERRLVVIAAEVSTAALSLLIVNRERGVLDGVLAVQAPGTREECTQILEDIAIATGGRALLKAAGASLSQVTIADLGRARQVWATADTFSILGGRGDKRAIRRRIGEVKAALHVVAGDAEARRRIRERTGKLAGTAAIIRVGAPTESARVELRVRIEAAVTAAQMALHAGAVPGGGAALVACAPALLRLADGLHPDEALGVRLLARALPAPMMAVVANAGIEASGVVSETHLREPGWTFDVLRRQWVEARAEGIIDPLPVVLAALEGAVSTALMALTTDVLVRRTHPSLAKNP